METLVAMWTLRLALVAAAGVALASYAAETSVLDAIDRGLVAAVVFTFAGQWLLDRLETPEARLQRMRAQRAARRAKGGKERAEEAKARSRVGAREVTA